MADGAAFMRRAGVSWRRARRRIPGTMIYFFVLAITTWMLRSLDSTVADGFLRSVSTNVASMSRDAPRVLVLSAFVIQGGNLLGPLVLFLAIHAPTEAWLGTRRWLIIAAAGHIGASMITTFGIFGTLRFGHGSRHLVYPVDVGVSYTLAAAAGALVYRLPKWWRPLAVLGVAGLFGGWHLFTGASFTDVGHIVALAIGLVVTPLLLQRSADRRTRTWRRHALATGAATFAVATVVLGVMAVAGPQRRAAAASPADEVPARVVAVNQRCESGCPNLELAYSYLGKRRTATVVHSTAGVRVGSSRVVEVHSAHPDVPLLDAHHERVDAQGIVVLGAVSAGVLALICWRLARRLRG